MEGCLKLEFASRDGVTQIVDRYQRAPLQVQKVLRPHVAHPGMAWVYIVSIAGGIVQGDRLQIEIVARDGAQVHLTTPAATKIYRSPACPSCHLLRIRAGAGTYVEYLPGPVIPFRGARFLEEVTLVAHPTATLLFGGILSPGRVAMGESHVYDLYSSRITAEGEDGALEFLDIMHLTPATIPPKRPGLLGRFDVLGTLHLLTGKGTAREFGDRLHRLLQEHGEILAGASELPSGRGVTVRILGRQVEPVAAALQAVFVVARAAILGAAELGGSGTSDRSGSGLQESQGGLSATGE
jgi:urease accessory protein